jgi:hypothetical protein
MKVNTSPNIKKASVASLRRCSPSSQNGVQLPSGMPFSFAGISSKHAFHIFLLILALSSDAVCQSVVKSGVDEVRGKVSAHTAARS